MKDLRNEIINQGLLDMSGLVQKKCRFDHDGDGNCHKHPQGCPKEVMKTVRSQLDEWAIKLAKEEKELFEGHLAINGEIKFRAWCKDPEGDRFYYFTLQEILERRMYYRGNCDEQILRGIKQPFTGLKDKKESELYADDIIDISRHGETTRHRIIWEKGGWQLSPRGPFPTQYLGCFNSEIIEKKGNVYENKDLLPWINPD